ncbi:MAG TPA: nicotinate (nicotinamide) nucleotide adenylyltransferase [Bacteroidia bacterium]|jgi:nicotinate-nucleotide adenylyltransferase|nr:nicotinate (nicotinamide) nucleotide adenylyltransferase [Bacteroidia bacterium]
MKIGLFFGSFNPVHIGHMAIANYMAEFTDLQQVWFVISPQNPLKPKNSLLADHHRLQLVRLAIGDSLKYKASNIEFKLPQPSYTVHTLAHLSEKYPQHRFVLIMGSDNLQTFHKWKNYEHILSEYQLYVYPRPGSDGGNLASHPQVKQVPAPFMDISATFLREAIKQKKNIEFFMPPAAYEYLREMHFYER